MAKPIERTIIQPVMPREIDLKEPMWFAVTEANLEQFVADIKEEAPAAPPMGGGGMGGMM